MIYGTEKKSSNGKKNFASTSVPELERHTLQSAFNGKMPRILRADYWHKYSKFILSTTLVVSLLSAGYATFGYTPKYTSHSSILVKDSALTAKYLTSDPYNTTSSITSSPILNTVELIKSTVVADYLWYNFVTKLPKTSQRSKIRDLTQWRHIFGNGKAFIAYRNPPGTDVINLSFVWNDPALSQEGMRVTLAGLTKASREINQYEHHQRSLYLASQITDIQEELQKVRSSISKFKAEKKISDISTEIQDYSKQRKDLELALKMADAEASSYTGQISSYEHSLGLSTSNAIIASSLGRTETLQNLYSEKYKLNQQYANLRSRYTDDNLQVKQVKHQIDKTNQDINTETSRILGNKITPSSTIPAFTDDARAKVVANLMDVQAQSKSSHIKASLIKKYYDTLVQRINKFPEEEEILANLKDEEQSLSESLQKIKTQALDAQMRETQTLSNVFLVSSPSLPTNAQLPTKIQIIFFGFLISLIGSSIISLWLDKLFNNASKETLLNSTQYDANN